MLLAPRRAVPAAQTLQQPGLGGSRLPSQAAGPQQPQGGPRAQASQPISDREKRSRSSRCAVECRRPACAQSQPRSASPLPARPSPPHPLPRLSHAARQRRAPTPSGTQPAESPGRGRARAGAGPGCGAGWERPPSWEGPPVGRIPRRGCGPRPDNPRSENVAFSTLSPPFVDTEAGVGLSRLLAGGVTPGNPLYAHLLPPSLRAFRVFFFPAKDHFAWIQ